MFHRIHKHQASAGRLCADNNRIGVARPARSFKCCRGLLCGWVCGYVVGRSRHVARTDFGIGSAKGGDPQSEEVSRVARVGGLRLVPGRAGLA